MLKNVIMPTLGVDMESATIERWLKSEGDRVEKDEPLLILETDKASTEIVAPATGILRQILQPQGATVPVKERIAVIEEGREGGEGTEGRELPSSSSDPSDPSHPSFPSIPSLPSVPSPQRASPAARRLARDLGVDLAMVAGSGPRGRIQGEDVERFAKMGQAKAGGSTAPAEDSSARLAAVEDGATRLAETADGGSRPAPPGDGGGRPGMALGLPGKLVPLSRKRRVTAERMALSSRTVARLVLNVDIDATELLRLRARLLPSYEGRGARLSYDAILARMVGVALAEHPYLNARWTDGGIYLVEPINVGLAMAVEDGLVVLVVRGANRLPLLEIAAELNRLQAKAREDRLAVEDFTGGTFTITNLGAFGVDSFIPIVNPPETAILGVGRIVERPVGRDGQIVLRPMMSLTLAVDHRIIDGAPAARFLQRVRELLEEPLLLV